MLTSRQLASRRLLVLLLAAGLGCAREEGALPADGTVQTTAPTPVPTPPSPEFVAAAMTLERLLAAPIPADSLPAGFTLQGTTPEHASERARAFNGVGKLTYELAGTHKSRIS